MTECVRACVRDHERAAAAPLLENGEKEAFFPTTLKVSAPAKFFPRSASTN